MLIELRSDGTAEGTYVATNGTTRYVSRIAVSFDIDEGPVRQTVEVLLTAADLAAAARAQAKKRNAVLGRVFPDPDPGRSKSCTSYCPENREVMCARAMAHGAEHEAAVVVGCHVERLTWSDPRPEDPEAL